MVPPYYVTPLLLTYLFVSSVTLININQRIHRVAMDTEDQLCCPATSNQLFSFHKRPCQGRR